MLKEPGGGKWFLTRAEAPRELRSTIWSIPFLPLVTSAAAFWSAAASELFIVKAEPRIHKKQEKATTYTLFLSGLNDTQAW